MWLEIAAYLRAAGYEDRDDGSCKTRIHTLISAYRSYKGRMRQDGKCHTKEEAGFLQRSGRAFVGQAMYQTKGNYKVRNNFHRWRR